eukprot:g25864.t1
MELNKRDNFKMRHERPAGERLSDASSSSSESSSDSSSDEAEDLDPVGLEAAVPEASQTLGAVRFQHQGAHAVHRPVTAARNSMIPGPGAFLSKRRRIEEESRTCRKHEAGLRPDATALGYLFSNVSFPGASSVAPLRCTRATPAGAPLFAIPWAKCWTQEAAERCPEVEAALTVAGRRNPSCELLHRPLGPKERGPKGRTEEEALRRKEQLRLEYLELQEELGDEVSQRLGLSASGFLKAHMALLLAGLDFGCGPVLVATARTSYAAGDLVEIFHRGQCLGSGCSLATFGSLPWCSAWEEVIVTLRLGPEVLEMGAVDFAQTAGQLEEALQRDLRERPPVQRAGQKLTK